ncbi:MAG: hypothetical protein LBD76_05925, partial [Prevotellaceae bacterium]|nr:hypothetical protein [Prevotellaceae bacterium]
MKQKKFIYSWKKLLGLSNTCALKIAALCILLSLNYGALGQDICSTLKGGKIKIEDGYDTICAGTSPQLFSLSGASGGSGVYAYQWQWRINGDNG